MGGGAGVNAQEIVQAAYQLLGAPYRQWHPGDPIPMWRKYGVVDAAVGRETWLRTMNTGKDYTIQRLVCVRGLWLVRGR
jgi:hypothetical protein